MIGLAQTQIVNLSRVEPQFNRYPIETVNLFQRLVRSEDTRLKSVYGITDPYKEALLVPCEIYERLDLEDLFKVKFSSDHTLGYRTEEVFRTSQPHRLFAKLLNSTWRWGRETPNWNDIVEASEGLKSFDIGFDGFSVTVDHTTGGNERGYSQYSRTFLDGSLAFLVHYRDEHVMTIGFSIMANKKLLIQQVQLVNRKGNRFLFKLPRNRLEAIIGSFEKAFPTYRLYMVDGASLACSIAESYEKMLRIYERGNRGIEADACRKSIARFASEQDRLISFYSDLGKYRRLQSLRVNNLVHHHIISKAAHPEETNNVRNGNWH